LRASTPSNAAELIAPDRQDVMNYLDGMAGGITGAAEEMIFEKQAQTDNFLTQMDYFMGSYFEKLSSLAGRLALYLKFFEERIIMQESKVDSFSRLMRSFNPKAVLDRGYAIVRKKGGLISSIRDLKSKDLVGVELKDGSFEAEVI